MSSPRQYYTMTTSIIITGTYTATMNLISLAAVERPAVIHHHDAIAL